MNMPPNIPQHQRPQPQQPHSQQRRRRYRQERQQAPRPSSTGTATHTHTNADASSVAEARSTHTNTAAAAITTTITTTNNNNNNNNAVCCLICFEALRDTTVVTKTPCGHDQMCAVCHVRLRYLHKDRHCPICKSSANAQLIVDYYHDHHDDDHNTDANHETNHKTFEEYPLWGDSLGDDFVYRADLGMFFPQPYYVKVIEPLLGYQCNMSGCTYDAAASASDGVANPSNTSNHSNSNHPDDEEHNNNNNNNSNSRNNNNPQLRRLQDHLRMKHRLALCNLCVEYQRDFVSQLPRYTPTQLKQHCTTGMVTATATITTRPSRQQHSSASSSSSSGDTGHPLCAFCRPQRFYDLTELYTHLNREHYKCHVCVHHAQLDHQYFRDYASLERHFAHKHFLCTHAQCLESRFVVFGTDLDLRHHERTVHGMTHNNNHHNKIQVESLFRFSSRRSSNHRHARIESSAVLPEEADFNFGLDGQAFVPEPLPSTSATTTVGPTTTTRTSAIAAVASTSSSSSARSLPLPPHHGEGGGVSLYAPHVQRTEQLRQQALAIRQRQQQPQGDRTTFPTLSEPTPTQQQQQQQPQPQPQPPLRTGWNQGTSLQRVKMAARGGGGGGGVIRQVTEESFPALPATASSSSSTAAAAAAAAASSRWLFSSQSSSRSADTSLWGKSQAIRNPTAIPPRTTTSSSTSTMALTPLSFSSSPSPSPSPSLSNTAHTNTSSTSTNPVPSQPKNRASNRTAGNFPSLARPTASTLNHNYNNSSSNNPFPPLTQPPPQKNTAAAAATATTVEEMKATLGSSKYKQFKAYTRAFAQGQLSPVRYIDQAAQLFETRGGVAAADDSSPFWKFVPTLVASIPVPTTTNSSAPEQAMQYLEQLRQQQQQNQHSTTERSS